MTLSSDSDQDARCHLFDCIRLSLRSIQAFVVGFSSLMICLVVISVVPRHQARCNCPNCDVFNLDIDWRTFVPMERVGFFAIADTPCQKYQPSRNLGHDYWFQMLDTYLITSRTSTGVLLQWLQRFKRSTRYLKFISSIPGVVMSTYGWKNHIRTK